MPSPLASVVLVKRRSIFVETEEALPGWLCNNNVVGAERCSKAPKAVRGEATPPLHIRRITRSRTNQPTV